MEKQVQRRILLVRHAKAVEDDAAGDHARSLSARGKADAAALGAWLEENALWPQLAVCSTATRTRETLAGLGKTIPTQLSDKMYLASVGELLSQIHQCDDAVACVMLIAHNPGLHGLLAMLVGDYADEADADKVMLKFPTAACAVLDVEAAHWRDIAPQTARLALLRHG